MRVKLKKNDLDEIFRAITKQGLNWPELSVALKISERNLRDWRQGKISIPLTAYQKCLTIAKLDSSKFEPLILDEYWHIKEAAKKGGRARIRLHGNFGTTMGRRKGGLVSIQTHKLKRTGFKTLTIINKPKQSVDLAELVGILVGDGHLSDYQVSVTTNSVTDINHANFVKSLFGKIFNLEATIKNKRGNALDIRVSSKDLVGYLQTLGMPKGNKIKNNLAVPEWVNKNNQYQKAFLRGLFDTDGCIYLDKHLIKGKMYKHMGWTITSYAGKLIEGIIEILKRLDLNPTHRISQKSVFLRRQNDIKRYFDEIGTHNSKHQERYLKFCGEVPKRS